MSYVGVSSEWIPCISGPSLDGNDLLLLCFLWDLMLLECYGYGVALGDDRSHMGGSDDMKLVEIVCKCILYLRGSYSVCGRCIGTYTTFDNAVISCKLYPL